MDGNVPRRRPSLPARLGARSCDRLARLHHGSVCLPRAKSCLRNSHPIRASRRARAAEAYRRQIALGVDAMSARRSTHWFPRSNHGTPRMPFRSSPAFPRSVGLPPIFRNVGNTRSDARGNKSFSVEVLMPTRKLRRASRSTGFRAIATEDVTHAATLDLARTLV